MFRNLRLSIFIYYFLTINAFLAILHYFLVVVQVQDVFFLALVMLGFSILGGVMISKLSIDPLEEHVTALQNLSKETLHELNLPISTIKTNSSMLKKNMHNEKDIKRLSRIETACDMLQDRYDELDYMIKKQSLHDVNEEFYLNELIEQRVDFLQNIYPLVEFKLELDETIIVNDKKGLSKVIDNLIDNGVKYAPNSDKYDIKLDKNLLQMQDYGCGMDEVELLQIFDRYYQSNENMDGFGIGLSMVKKFCDKNEILLSFKSEPNIGTTVLLKFKED